MEILHSVSDVAHVSCAISVGRTFAVFGIAYRAESQLDIAHIESWRENKSRRNEKTKRKSTQKTESSLHRDFRKRHCRDPDFPLLGMATVKNCVRLVKFPAKATLKLAPDGSPRARLKLEKFMNERLQLQPLYM